MPDLGPLSRSACLVRLYHGADFWKKAELQHEIERELGPCFRYQTQPFYKEMQMQWALLQTRFGHRSVDISLHRAAVEWKIQREEFALVVELKTSKETMELCLAQEQIVLEIAFFQELDQCLEVYFDRLGREVKEIVDYVNRLVVCMKTVQTDCHRVLVHCVWVLFLTISILRLPWRLPLRSSVAPWRAQLSLICGITCFSCLVSAKVLHARSRQSLKRLKALYFDHASIKRRLNQMRCASALEVNRVQAQHTTNIKTACECFRKDYEAQAVRARQLKLPVFEGLRRLKDGVWTCFEGSMSAHVSSQKLSPSDTQILKRIFNEFKGACAGEVEALRANFQEQRRLEEAALKAKELAFESALDKEKCVKMDELQNYLVSRSVMVALPAFHTLRFGEPVAPANFSLHLSFQWIGCPGSCALMGLSTAFASEIAQLPFHCRDCPAMWRCEICGFAVPPSHDHHDRVESHRRKCAPWQIDGLLVRHFFATPPPLPASGTQAAMRMATQIFDKEGFVRTAQTEMYGSCAVCCPHFGCDEVFGGRSLALRHAASCMHQCRPLWSIEELKARMSCRTPGIAC